MDVETLAADYLREQGMRIVARNFRSRRGEVDIIGYHGRYLVFVEVKYRASDSLGMPQEAVGLKKQQRICGTADFYRYTHGIPLSTPVRYDVVAVLGGEITWYRDAFPHRERRG